jgi:hypothetical protein
LRLAEISAVISPGTSDNVNDTQDFDPWVLTKREENRLLVFERKVRPIKYGPKIVVSVYRSRYNFELEREFIGVVKNFRLRLTADETMKDRNSGGRMA